MVSDLYYQTVQFGDSLILIYSSLFHILHLEHNTTVK